MKKWLYFIVPVVCLGVFLFFYYAHVEEAKKRTLIRIEEQAKKDREEAAKKKALEDKARQDADKRSAERAKEEAKKEADRIAKWKAQGDDIEAEMQKAKSAASESQQKVAALEKELSSLRAKKEQANRDFLEAARQVELAKIARRNAEMEIQRITELISNKANESAMAKLPPMPAPVPAKK